MDIASTIPHGGSEVDSCGHCGAKFRVIITTQSGHNETEDYNCPECNSQFFARASMPIRVVLISKRTDGRTN